MIAQIVRVVRYVIGCEGLEINHPPIEDVIDLSNIPKKKKGRIVRI